MAPQNEALSCGETGPAPAGRVLALAFGVGAALAVWTAIDLLRYLAQDTFSGRLSDPFQAAKLRGIALWCAALAVAWTVAAWMTGRRTGRDRRFVEHWSPLAVAMVVCLIGYLWLLYYPLPSHRHHLDKMLLLLGLVSAWTVLYLGRPAWLQCASDSAAYGWLRVAMVNVLVFGLAGESVSRVADPMLARSGLFGDARTPASLRPHREVQGSIHRSNGHGFRDRERAGGHHDLVRLVALGDSFTWGAGVSYDETFVTLVERELERDRPGMEVVNLGVPGFEPEHELDLLVRYGLELEPDLVLMNFYVGNDIMRKRGADVEDIMTVGGHVYYAHHNGNWVHDRIGLDRSYLYQHLRYFTVMTQAAIRRLRGGRDLGFWDAPRPGPGTGTSQDGWHPGYLQNVEERSEVFLAEETPLFRLHWSHTVDTLTRLQQVLSGRSIPWVLILIPDQVQVDARLQSAFLAASGAPSGRYDFEKPLRLLRSWGADANVPVIDLSRAFKEADAPSALYILNDSHWTPEGHRLAASVLLPRLRREVASAELRVATGKRVH